MRHLRLRLNGFAIPVLKVVGFIVAMAWASLVTGWVARGTWIEIGQPLRDVTVELRRLNENLEGPSALADRMGVQEDMLKDMRLRMWPKEIDERLKREGR